MLGNIVIDTLVTGLPLVPVFLGIYIVLRLREDFDLTVEGSFAFGGGVCAVLLSHSHNPLLALAAGAIAGGLAGLATSLLHLWLNIPVVLAGLVMSIALFSITLRVTKLPTINLIGVTTIYSPFTDSGAQPNDTLVIIVLAAIVGAVLTAFALFLRTEIGLALRASGVNAVMVRSQGANDRALLVLSLVGSNALSGFGAGLVVQTQGYADINMGVGTFVAGVGAVLLGVLILRPGGSQVVRIVLCVLVGTLLYRFILVGALRIGVPANDLKGITALTLIVAVAAQKYISQGLGRLRLRGPGSLPADSEGVMSR
ncbi:ABC transporter permease [soil metagenome]